MKTQLLRDREQRVDSHASARGRLEYARSRQTDVSHLSERELAQKETRCPRSGTSTTGTLVLVRGYTCESRTTCQHHDFPASRERIFVQAAHTRTHASCSERTSEQKRPGGYNEGDTKSTMGRTLIVNTRTLLVNANNKDCEPSHYTLTIVTCECVEIKTDLRVQRLMNTST